MLTFVVMPCLNEAGHVAAAAASLGFAGGTEPPRDAELLLVDNGSTDGTPEILQRIARASPGAVRALSEPVRGYVPPRHRGVVEAAASARARGVEPRDVLVLQADADTAYKPGYVAAMRAAVAGHESVMLEGATRRPSDFEADHPDYVRAERQADGGVEALEGLDEDEVVVDDKACGYRLSDYLAWGGLFEERSERGEQIHAETTRLFMRARLGSGARKLRVNPAGAASSRRRVIEDPWLQFATSGFPRERSWADRWTGLRRPGRDVDEFARAVLAGEEPDAAFLRRAHANALFRVLPILVARALGSEDRANAPADVATALRALPARSAADIAARPGRTLAEVLALIDTRPDLFG